VRVAAALACWPVTVGVVEVGMVSQSSAGAERYRCACLHYTHRRWLGVVAGISATSTGGFLVWVNRPLAYRLVAWSSGKRRSLAGVLLLSCARPAADG